MSELVYVNYLMFRRIEATRLGIRLTDAEGCSDRCPDVPCRLECAYQFQRFIKPVSAANMFQLVYPSV